MSTNLVDIKKQLLEKLHRQYDAEKYARDSYQIIVDNISDDSIINPIRHVISDEERHMKAVEEAIAIVHSCSTSIMSVSSEHVSPLKDVVQSGSVLLIDSMQKYAYTMILAIEEYVKKNIPIVYVSINKSSKYIKTEFEKHNISQNSILYVSCSENHSDYEIGIDPEDLTKLSITISSAVSRLQKLAQPVIIIDALPSFLIHHAPEKIMKLVSAINSRSVSKEMPFTIVWVTFSTNASEKSLNESIIPLSGKVIDTQNLKN